MKKSIKNIALTLGSVGAVTAPVAAVISCGSSTPEVPKDVLKQRELFAKSSGIIQNAYQEQLLLEISNAKDSNNNYTHNQYGQFVADDFKHDENFTSWKNFTSATGRNLLPLIKKFVTLNIFQNNDYLATLGDKLLKITNPDGIEDSNHKKPLFSRAELVVAGLYDRFWKNETDIEAKAKILKDDAAFSKLFKTVWEKNVGGFRTVFYKFLIVNYYLDTNKTNWMDVFINSNGATGKINGIEGSIEESEFVLGQALVRAKLAYNWKAELTDESSKKWIGKSMKESELDTEMSLITPASGTTAATYGKIAKDLTVTQQQSLVPTFYQSSNAVAATGDNFWKMLNNNKNITGFTGIVAKADLAKDDSFIRQAVDKDHYDENYYGYIDIEKSDLIKSVGTSTDVKLTTSEKPKVSIEKDLMIMPMYQNGKLNLSFFNESTASNSAKDYSTLKTILFMNSAGASLYDDAIKYYSSKDCKEFPIKDANGAAVNDKDGKPTFGIRFNIIDKNLREIALNGGLTFVQKVEE